MLYGQTLIRGPKTMANISREECLTVEQAISALKISKATLYNYMNILDIQSIKFRFERKAFIAKTEVERIREFMKARNQA